MLAAIDALRAAKMPLSANLKFFLEGEEEAGSPNLARDARRRIATLLASDLWIFGDGPIDPRGLPRIALGARGVTGFPTDRVRAGDQPALRPLRQCRAESRRAACGAHRIDARRRTAASRSTASQRPPPSPAALALAREAFDTRGMLAAAGIGATESGLDYGESILRPVAQRHAASLWRRGRAAQRHRSRSDRRLRPPPRAGHDGRRAHARPSRRTCARRATRSSTRRRPRMSA